MRNSVRTVTSLDITQVCTPTIIQPVLTQYLLGVVTKQRTMDISTMIVVRVRVSLTEPEQTTCRTTQSCQSPGIASVKVIYNGSPHALCLCPRFDIDLPATDEEMDDQ